jgi:hypothetical protein
MVADCGGLVAGTGFLLSNLAGTGCFVDTSLPCPPLGRRHLAVERGPQRVVFLLVACCGGRWAVVPGCIPICWGDIDNVAGITKLGEQVEWLKYEAQIVIFCILAAVNRCSQISQKVESR